MSQSDENPFGCESFTFVPEIGVEPDRHVLALLYQNIQRRRVVTAPPQEETFGQLLHRQEFQMGVTRWDRLDFAGSGISLD